MADIKLVIKIDEEYLKDIKERVKDGDIDYEPWVAIANGIQLPKGHGRLVDEKDVIDIYDNDDRLWWGNALDDIREFVPTIIGADKENE